MIISASRRTDLPAYYSDWLFERLRQGRYCAQPHEPPAREQDKPAPGGCGRYCVLDQKPCADAGAAGTAGRVCLLLQFTLTAYGPDVEPHVPTKEKTAECAFKRLSEAIGPGQVVWRYDPIFLSEGYTFDDHLRSFAALAQRLQGYTTPV